jgi:hypothetical protein
MLTNTTSRSEKKKERKKERKKKPYIDRITKRRRRYHNPL